MFPHYFTIDIKTLNNVMTIYTKFVIHKKLFAYHLYTVRNLSFSENNAEKNN